MPSVELSDEELLDRSEVKVCRSVETWPSGFVVPVDPVLVAEIDAVDEALDGSLALDPRFAISCINIADMAFAISDPLASIDDEDDAVFEVAFDVDESSCWDELSWLADVWDRNR